jgi:hypothetical protein
MQKYETVANWENQIGKMHLLLTETAHRFCDVEDPAKDLCSINNVTNACFI